MPIAASEGGGSRLFRALPGWPSWAWPVAGGGGVLGAVFVIWLIVRFVHYTGTDLKVKQRMLSESESTRLDTRRQEVKGQLASQDAWQRIIGQVAADALGRPVEIDPETPPRVSGRPAPHFIVTAYGGKQYVFTTDVGPLQEAGILQRPGSLLDRKTRPVHLPYTQVEPGLVWQYLADKFLYRTEGVPVVPTTAEWYLMVQDPVRPAAEKRAPGLPA